MSYKPDCPPSDKLPHGKIICLGRTDYTEVQANISLKSTALTSELLQSGTQRWSRVNLPLYMSQGQVKHCCSVRANAATAVPPPSSTAGDGFQKPGRKEHAAILKMLMSCNSQGTAFCWLCRPKGPSEPHICTLCPKHRGQFGIFQSSG